MSAFWVITRMRILDVLRSKSSTGFILGFPIVLMVCLGIVFMNGHPFERHMVAVVGEFGDDEPAIAAIRTALAPLDEVRVERVPEYAMALGRLRARMASAILIVPAGASPPRLVVGPRDQLFGRGLAAALPVAPSVVVLEVPRWGYVHYLFPGLLAFSILVSGIAGMAYTMVLYRQNGFLKKLATTPLRRSAFVGAQLAARMVLVLAQVALLVATAWLGFELRFDAAALAWTFAISATGLLAFLGLGFALACVIRTGDLVIDVINAINLPLILLSEMFFALDALPRPLAALGAVLPSTQLVRLLRDVMLYGVHDAAALLPGLGILIAWTIGGFGLSLWAFKWQR
jgi:ABC-2 type transport system permease protein